MVTAVKVSPDLGVVRAYLSLYQVANKEETLDLIRFHGKDIRKQLAGRLRHQVRKIPELEFFLDESLDYAQHMDEVFRKLNQERGQEKDPN